MKRVTLCLAWVTLSAAVACGGNEPPKPLPAKGAKAAGPAPGPVAAAPTAAAAPEATVAPPSDLPRPDFPEDEFTESATRSRDPFRSFAATFVEQDRVAGTTQREVVLGDFSIDDLKIGGIVSRSGQPKAMLIDPGGKGYVVRRGQFVGRADVVQMPGKASPSYELNWRVDRIREQDIVFVREDPAHPDLPSATRVVALRPEGNTEK